MSGGNFEFIKEYNPKVYKKLHSAEKKARINFRDSGKDIRDALEGFIETVIERYDLSRAIQNTMELVYPFEEKGVEIVATERTVVPIVKLDARAFRKYRTWIINFLIGIHQDGEYLITNERLYGKIISLRTEDLQILDVAKRLHDVITVHGKMNIVRRLKDKFKDYEGEDNIIDLIEKELKESFV